MKTIYLTRHAEGFHNLNESWDIHDAELTLLGIKQSKELNQLSKFNYQNTARLLVSSPLKRTLQTTLHSYPHLIKRLGGPQNIIILPILQEVNDFACDVGSPKEILESLPQFSDLDFSLLTPDWTSKKGIYAPLNADLRAKEVRKWLRSRKEDEIVVVAHGDILRMITDGVQSFRHWGNAEVKIYTFESEGEEDEEAKLIPLVLPVPVEKDVVGGKM